jgi:hypothetical protein
LKIKKTNNDKIYPLRKYPNFRGGDKINLEHRVFKELNIRVDDSRLLNKNTQYNIYTPLPKRNILIPDNIEIVNPTHDINIVPTYINDSFIMLTVSVFDNKYINSDYTVIFNINNCNYAIDICLEYTKFTHILEITNTGLVKKSDDNYKCEKIIQTSSTKKMSKNRYYSILTVLNNGT